jgi:hypothetical protein
MRQFGVTRGSCVATVLLLNLCGGAACTPQLTPPRESIRVSGTVEDVANPVAAPPVASEATDTHVTTTPAPTLGAAKAGPVRAYPALQHLPLGVAVYEACSTQLYMFKKCPGRFLGEAKLAKPGPFVVEFDTDAPEIVVFAFRGFLGPEQTQEACAETTIPTREATRQLTLKLQLGSCSIKLERRYG